jgi:hypothetical protein
MKLVMKMSLRKKFILNFNRITMNLSYAWSDAVSPERRDLVFENRNKEYGGFVIRAIINAM